MICKKCGKEFEDGLKVCPHCDEFVEEANEVVEVAEEEKEKKDSGSIWWGVLGFCIPLVGLILWLVWKGDKPKCARKSGIGALISVILGIVAYVIMFVVLGKAIAGI